MRIPQIIRQLSALETPVIDRAICERVFGVKRRRAITLMQHWEGYRTGNAILLDRLALITTLRQLEESAEITWEWRRKERLARHLEQLDRQHRATRVSLPLSKQAHPHQADNLPATVSLAKGKLTVRFTSVEDLFGQLFVLAQAAVNDFEALRQVAQHQLPGR